MTKASSIFDVYPEANWITKEKDGTVLVWDKKPSTDKRGWMYMNNYDNSELLGKISVDEFKGKDWTECCIERPKEAFEPPLKYEDLKKWALENGGKNFSCEDFVIESKDGVYYVIPNKDSISIACYSAIIYTGTPAQVKRVLEAMLND